MPHHLRQTVHHNINQDATTENIERPQRSASDPEVRAQLEEAGDQYDDHKSNQQESKPPRGVPDQGVTG